MDYAPFWWGPWMMFPMIMPALMVVALVVCLYFFFGRGPRPDSALNILKERYAKGEITKEEFERMKQDILS